VQDVQFVGQAVQHGEATQWMVTWAMLSNGMTVSSHDEVCRQNEGARLHALAWSCAHGLATSGITWRPVQSV
jgi:hypothetical protein